jgi:uncharacterized membrane protein YbhN (UPF0104 family)
MEDGSGALAVLRPVTDRLRRSWPACVAVVLAVLGVGYLLSTTGPLSGFVGSGLSALRSADPVYLWLAGTAFVAALAASAAMWRSVLAGCGAQVAPLDACARYGVGSLVNTFAPARLGDAARIALFSRTLPEQDARLLTTGGALAAIGLTRATVQGALLAAAAALGALPLWPALVAAGLAVGGVAVAVVVRDRLPRHRVSHLLDACRALARSPRRALRLLAWAVIATAARVLAATAICVSLGVHSPLLAGAVITSVLDLAVAVPITPGTIGITSGAVAFALESHGVALSTAAAAGLAFHGVETAAGLSFGTAGTLLLTCSPTPAARRWWLGLAGAACAAVTVVAVGTSILPDF